MLSLNKVEDILGDIGFDQVDFMSDSDVDKFGDYVTCNSDNLKFDDVKIAFIKSVKYNQYIVSAKPDRIDLSIRDTYNGMGVEYDFVVFKTVLGVKISTIYKRVEYYNALGEYKPVMGFEMLSHLKNN